MDLLLFVLWWQIEEEPEVPGHRSSHVVHTHSPGYLQAFYQVIHTDTNNCMVKMGNPQILFTS